MADLVTTASSITVAERILGILADDIALAAAMKAETAGRRLARDLRFRLASSDLDARISDLWRGEGRQIMMMHPDLVETVGAAKGDIVSEALRALPYRNPLVCLAQPIELAADPATDTVGYLEGFFCFGRHDDGLHARPDGIGGTHAPETTLLGVLAIITVRNATTGDVLDAEFDRFSIPLTAQHQDIGNLAHSLARTGNFTDFSGNTSGAPEYIETALRHILGVLMYLCSTTLDVEAVPASRVRRMKSGSIARNKPPKVTKVGWTLGPALTHARRLAADASNTNNGTKLRPHQRAAHFKTVWVGAGRQTPRLTFIAPYMTGTKSLSLNTIHLARPRTAVG